MLVEQSLSLRPSRTSLVQNVSNSNIGNGSFLSHFSISGFAKCGTSTIVNWLHKHQHETNILMVIRDMTYLMNYKLSASIFMIHPKELIVVVAYEKISRTENENA